MTQITKTLSIAGIIALVTAPAMADIASTEYVNNIVNNMIPQSGTVGHVLKKTATGLEWAAAPTPTLETTTGQSTTATMTQKAITDALNKKVENTAVGGGANRIALLGGTVEEWDEEVGRGFNVMAIGPGAVATDQALAIGDGAKAGDTSVAIGSGAKAADGGYDGTAIGAGAEADDEGVAVGYGTEAGVDSVAIGEQAIAESGIAIGSFAEVRGGGAIQLGSYSSNPFTNDEANTFKVGFSEHNYTLLDGNDGTIPYERFAPEIPNTCKAANNQTCALVIKWNSAQNKFTQSWEVVKIN